MIMRHACSPTNSSAPHDLVNHRSQVCVSKTMEGKSDCSFHFPTAQVVTKRRVFGETPVSTDPLALFCVDHAGPANFCQPF